MQNKKGDPKDMKKLINNPDRVVTEMLQGLCEAEPELVYAGEGIEVVSRREKHRAR